MGVYRQQQQFFSYIMSTKLIEEENSGEIPILCGCMEILALLVAIEAGPHVSSVLWYACDQGSTTINHLVILAHWTLWKCTGFSYM